MQVRLVAGSTAVVSAVGAWIVSPRFSLGIPSLTDDWSAIRDAGAWISDYLHLDDPEPQRFRPGWVVWNYLQWHTLGAPAHMLGPNIWNVARLAVLAAGVSLVTLLLIRPPPGGWPGRALQAALVALPALLIVTTPGIAEDLARFAPQEPALLGSMLLGGSLLFLAARALVRGMPSWPIAGLLAAAGAVLWIFGAYQKETSICAVVLLAALRIANPSWWRRVRALELRRRLAVWSLAAVTILPLAHVALMSLLIERRGALRYGETPQDWGYLHRTWHLVDEAPSALRSITAPLLVVVAVVGVAVTVAVRRRADWIPIGLVATAAGTIVMSAQAGAVPSRYYLPTLALSFMTLSVLASRLALRYQAVWVLLAGAAVLAYAGPARSRVEKWAEYERAGARIVSEATRLEETGCPVALEGLYDEHMIALPYLVSLRTSGTGSCRDGSAYLVLGLADSGARVEQACTGASKPFVWTSVATVYRCDSLRPGVKTLVSDRSG